VRIRRRSPALILLLALLLTAIGLTACGSGSSGSSTTVGPGDTKTYKDAAYGYSFEYPASWQIQTGAGSDVTAGGTSAGGVGVFDPKGAKTGSTYVDLMLVSVYKLNATVNDSNLPQVKSEIETVLKSLESQATDMKQEKPLAQTTAAGMNGYDVTYSFTKDGTPCTSTLYFLFDGNVEYQLTTQASNDNWATDQPIFDAMIASFKPGPAT
jgi:PsbP-like protein